MQHDFSRMSDFEKRIGVLPEMFLEFSKIIEYSKTLVARAKNVLFKHVKNRDYHEH